MARLTFVVVFIFVSFLALTSQNEDPCDSNFQRNTNGSEISESQFFDYVINLGPDNKWVRPVKNMFNPIEVKLDLVLTHILDVASIFFFQNISFPPHPLTLVNILFFQSEPLQTVSIYGIVYEVDFF